MGRARTVRTLVVGHGSIGRRHARILSELRCDVAVVSRRPVETAPGYQTLAEALSGWAPEYVVIANRTSEHLASISELIEQGFTGRVLIEKPLFDRVHACPRHEFVAAAVAYNLRFHPLLRALKALVDSANRVHTANIYAGMYLPNWRPESNYRAGYSASRTQGGGALRDLSHELDYSAWLLGRWRRLTAAGGHTSDLAIETDDAFSLLCETERCPLVAIHVNYLDRVPRREIVINTDRHTLRLDLIHGVLQVDGLEETRAVARDDTYRAEHQAMLDGDGATLCSVEAAEDVLLTIECAEQAAEARTWITR